MPLSNEQITEIGLSSARRLVGSDRVSDVRAVTGQASTGSPAVFFEFLVEAPGDRQKVALLRTRLSQSIRDQLIQKQDATYPFVRFLDRAERHRLHG